jgi:hypothetical protein
VARVGLKKREKKKCIVKPIKLSLSLSLLRAQKAMKEEQKSLNPNIPSSSFSPSCSFLPEIIP